MTLFIHKIGKKYGLDLDKNIFFICKLNITVKRKDSINRVSSYVYQPDSDNIQWISNNTHDISYHTSFDTKNIFPSFVFFVKQEQHWAKKKIGNEIYNT